MAERRYDMNLQGLLRFALETKSEDTNGTVVLDEMNEERKQFLDNALKSMTVDVIKEFKLAIATLENSSDTATTEQKAAALNVIREQIDNFDFANNFVQLGGTFFLMKHLNADSNELRVTVIYIVAEMAQNNPFCQQHFLDIGIFPQLLAAMKEQDKNVASSAIHAISSLVRNFEPGVLEFVKLSGLGALLTCLRTSHSKVFIKACFLIATLSNQNMDVRNKFAQSEAVEALAPHVETVSAYDIKLEAVLYALAEVSSGSGGHISPTAKKELECVLKEIVELNKNLPECEELVAYANTVLSNLLCK